MPKLQSQVLPKKLHPAHGHDRSTARVSPRLIEAAPLAPEQVYAKLDSRPEGLTSAEAEARILTDGLNVLGRDARVSLFSLLWHAVLNPLVLLLAVLAGVSFATGDARAGTMMVAMIGLSTVLKLVREARADRSAAKLKAMISVKATVVRDGAARELDIAHLVPGDVVHLGAGDMIPGDVRLVQARDLFVIQSALTGESFPVEKFQVEKSAPGATPIELTSAAFLGTSVESGTAIGVVAATGAQTYLGGLAEALGPHPAQTAFDKGISRFTWLMIRFMAVLVPLVFVINGLTRGSWSQAFFFAVAVAVGLTPEMLPMIVTVCLSNGAVAMGKKKVIVKRLNAIQNLGAMDVLCTDKTGTLTMDRVILERHCDVALREDEGVLALAYTNSHFQTGLKSVLDRAVLAHEAAHGHARILQLAKVDEIPFDFQRRVMSVVVRTPEGKDRLISKGAPEAIFTRCTAFELDGALLPMDHAHIGHLKEEYERLSAEGFRVLAIASKDVEPRPAAAGATPYSKADEAALVLNGYVAFLDPPKETAGAAIAALEKHGVSVKVITGDNELVSRKVCREVGIPTERVLTGAEVEKLGDAELATAAQATTLFARVSPADKRRIILALQSLGHTVGFLGDGINDAAALHVADVGISVDTAVDIARESADIILLERSLMVLDEGVLEGRKVFANILKYVRMGASSNFGNMFSVLGASLFVPFLPMLPIQILANNLLYDIGQAAVPTDAVDADQLQKPRPWELKQLTRFIVFIGPCSSIFDYSTYFLMLGVFGCWDVSTPAIAAHSQSLFQTGWFVESLLTQTLIIHVIRTTRIPFLQSRASPQVLAMSGLIIAVGLAIPFTPVGDYLGFTALPPLFFAYLAGTLLAYVLLTQGVKMFLLKRGWI